MMGAREALSTLGPRAELDIHAVLDSANENILDNSEWELHAIGALESRTDFRIKEIEVRGGGITIVMKTEVIGARGEEIVELCELAAELADRELSGYQVHARIDRPFISRIR